VLLVVPALGIFAGEIEPDGSGVRSGPAKRTAERIRVERAEVAADLLSGEAEKVNEEARTDAARGPEPGVVQVVDEGDQFIPTLDRRAGRRVAVALAREDAHVTAQEVQRHIPDGPTLGDGRQLPLFGGEGGEEGEEVVQ
jgi:hypothetical protein